MRGFRYQVVVGQRDPVSVADLAGGGAGVGVDWRRRGGGGDIGIKDRGEEICKGGRSGEKGVGL